MLETLEDRCLLSSSIPLSAASWTPIGPAPVNNSQVPGNLPSSGRITGLAADPTNANVFYLAAAGGGVWKTTNAGASWTPLTDDQATEFMGAIAVAPSSPNVIYAGTGEANNSGDSYYGQGILKSSDGGQTWTLEDQTDFNRRTVFKIAVDPRDANTVYAAVSGNGVNGLTGNAGIWKSSDGGATWTNTTASISTNDDFTDVIIDPTTTGASAVLYAAIGTDAGSARNGVYKSTNGGSTWTKEANFPSVTGDGRISLALAPSSTSTVYAAVATVPNANGDTSLALMEKSTDGGATWARLTNTPNFLGTQADYNNVLAVSPTNPNILFGGGSVNNAGKNAIVETTDGGTTWFDISVGSGAGANTGPHTDHHALAFDASGRLLDGNDGGVWRLDANNPAGNNVVWTDLNSNLNITQFTGIALVPNDPNRAYGGSQDNGTEKFTDNPAWTQVQQGDGGFVRVDPQNPSTVYHTFFFGPGGFIERSDNGGQTWTNIAAGININDNANFYPPYVIDPNNASRLLLGTQFVYVTTNKGATAWTKLGSGFNFGVPIDSIAIAPTNSNTIYVSAGSKIFVTTNNGATWTNVAIPGATGPFNGLAVDPGNSQLVYAAQSGFGGGRVFRSTNGGQAWTDISGNLPALPANALAIDPGTTILWVGTDDGVYATADDTAGAGTTWVRFQSGLPHAQVVELQLDPQDNILAAGTHGRGMWETLANTIPVQITLATPTESQPLTNVVVATFTDPTGAAPVGNYNALIQWGDGATSIGNIASDGRGGFTISASHTYSEEGTFNLTVSATNTVTHASGSSTIPFTVADAPLIGGAPQSLSSVVGAGVSATLVATFTDTDQTNTAADPQGVTSDYTATIIWDEGGGRTNPVNGLVVSVGANNYAVYAGNAFTYAFGGVFGATVIVRDGTTSVTINDIVQVADNPAIPPKVPVYVGDASPKAPQFLTLQDATTNLLAAEIIFFNNLFAPPAQQLQAFGNFMNAFTLYEQAVLRYDMNLLIFG